MRAKSKKVQTPKGADVKSPARDTPSSKGSASGPGSSSKGQDPERNSRSLKVSPLSLPMLRSYVKSDAVVPTIDSAFVKELSSATETVGSPQLSINSFLCCKETFAITGGSDRVIRFWDLREPPDSYRISSDDIGPESHLRYMGRTENNTVVFEEVLSSSTDLADTKSSGADSEEKMALKLQLAQKRRGLVPPPTAHQADILDVKAIEFPQKMLASCDRSGIIKIWV